VEETRVFWENNDLPQVSDWQTLSHNALISNASHIYYSTRRTNITSYIFTLYYRYIITSDNHYTIYENGSLIIRAIAKEDSGVYACRIDTGSQDSVIQRFKLKVEGMWY
jgi:hypothetical protein